MLRPVFHCGLGFTPSTQRTEYTPPRHGTPMETTAVINTTSPRSRSHRSVDHATLRRAQRGVNDRELDYVLRHGSRIQRTGVTFCMLRRVDVPDQDRRNDHLMKLVGTVVLINEFGQHVTVYRNQDAWRTIKRKSRRRSPAKYDPMLVQI